MEPFGNTADMLDLMAQPAFCVEGGIVTRINPSAQKYPLTLGAPAASLIASGSEEYADFSGGCLYLTLSLPGGTIGASVSRIGGQDIFVLERDPASPELQALALAAQQLRDPLSSAMAAADTLFPTVCNTPDAREQSARINKSLYRLLRIVSNMSDAARYGAETLPRQENMDISAVFDEIMDKAGTLMEQTGIALQYRGLPKPLYCLIDEEKLERGIHNMLSNALKFTPKGGTIAVSAVQRGDKVCFSVTDTGAGTAQKPLAAFFDQHTREPGIEDGRCGLGLGMSVIRTAAASHGGAVLLDQQHSGGLRVTLTVSLRRDPAARLRSPAYRVDYAGERDHGLLELCESLPATAFTPDKVN